METARNHSTRVSDVTNCVEGLNDHASRATHGTQQRKFDRAEDGRIPDDMEDGRSAIAKTTAHRLRMSESEEEIEREFMQPAISQDMPAAQFAGTRRNRRAVSIDAGARWQNVTGNRPDWIAKNTTL
jgi:hypothetical protein